MKATFVNDEDEIEIKTIPGVKRQRIFMCLIKTKVRVLKETSTDYNEIISNECFIFLTYENALKHISEQGGYKNSPVVVISKNNNTGWKVTLPFNFLEKYKDKYEVDGCKVIKCKLSEKTIMIEV